MNLNDIDFIHLHVHTVYSILDGANQIPNLLQKCKKLGMTSLAITDHGTLGGWYDFYYACKEANIKPILGCELYQTYDTNILSLDANERKKYAINKAKENGVELPDISKLKTKKQKEEFNNLLEPYEYNTKRFHIILLAMNQTGYNNLIKLQSEASEKCTYSKNFCCDFDMLEKYNEGIICLSACISGIIPYTILQGRYEEAESYVQRFKQIFDDRFYLEIQPFNDPQQTIVNNYLIYYADKYNIKLVATNDSHYTEKDDWDDHDTLLCIGLGKSKNDPDRMHYKNEFWFKSKEEMYETFQYHNIEDKIILDAINNSKLIADRISDDIKMGSDTPLFPSVEVPNGLTPEQYLSEKTFHNLYIYKKQHPEINIRKYEHRLNEELDVINTKGFAPYILKIIENVEYCEANDIPIGPGRGSAAGALTLFVNGVTKIVDPIKYDLLFFRFLTKDRVDPPDYLIA